MLESIKFASPEYFYLLLLILPIVVWHIFKQNKLIPTIQVSDSRLFDKRNSLLLKYNIFYHFLFILKISAFILLVIALARPQTFSSKQSVNVEGIDIILAMDISSSMLAEDFNPNRLVASKEVAKEFIISRANDRIGLVIFSGESFTQCPLTTDHAILINLLSEIKSGMIEDGTAIGDGLATSVNRLKESKAISKVIILLTDGENNSGFIDPLSASEIAKQFNIRVYTIGVGTIGTAPYPVPTPFGIQYQQVEVKIDEPLLKTISQNTNGKYFRATNNKALKNIYSEIDKLEKSKIDITEFKNKKDEFLPFAIAAFAILLLYLLLNFTIFKRIP